MIRWGLAPETRSPLREWLCVDKLEMCCPQEHFGPKCQPCGVLGLGEKVCSGNGKCKGSGTRKGNGKCSCNKVAFHLVVFLLILFQIRSMGAINAISAVRTIMRASETRRNCSVLPVIRFFPNIRIKHHGNYKGLLEYLFHNSLQACEGHCTGSGPKSCTACKSGFNMNTEHGCLVSGSFVKW